MERNHLDQVWSPQRSCTKMVLGKKCEGRVARQEKVVEKKKTKVGWGIRIGKKKRRRRALEMKILYCFQFRLYFLWLLFFSKSCAWRGERGKVCSFIFVFVGEKDIWLCEIKRDGGSANDMILKMFYSFTLLHTVLETLHHSVTGWDRSHGLPALSHVWQHVKLSDALSWGPSAI